jgi:uncharacterized protein
MALLSISAHDLDTAGFAVDVDLPVPWLEQELCDAELTAVAPGHFDGRLSRSGNLVVIRGRVRADVQTSCARCLLPATVHVLAEVSLLLKPAAPAAAPRHTSDAHDGKRANGASKAAHKEPEWEFSAEDADVDTYDGETVVLDPFIREAILLEIPNFPLCSEACPGIRPAAEEPAAEPAVDPRLAPLRALRAKIAEKRPAARPAPSSPEPPKAPKKKKNKE